VPAFLLALLATALLFQDPPAQDWATLDRQAEDFYTRGDLKEAIRVANLAVEAASGTQQSGHSTDRLGFFEYTFGDYKNGERHLRQAFELRKSLGTGTADYAESANDLALFCRDHAKLPEGRMLAEQAVSIRSLHCLEPGDSRPIADTVGCLWERQTSPTVEASGTEQYVQSGITTTRRWTLRS